MKINNYPKIALSVLLFIGNILCFNVPIKAQRNALAFDGAGDYLSVVPNELLNFGTKEFTIGFWVNFRSLAHRYHGLMARNDFQWLASSYNWAGDNSVVLWADANGSSGWENPGLGASKKDWIANTWYHIAYQRKGNELRIYINGELGASTSFAYSLYNPPSIPLYFGRTQLPQYTLNGLMDDIRIWNYALDQVELKASIGQELTGREPGLIAYFPLNETLGKTAQDATGNFSNATLVDNTSFVPSDSPVVSGIFPDAAFSPVIPTGLPYNIVLNSISIDGTPLPLGSQVAVYDGEVCVGASVYNSSGNLPIVAWKADPAMNLQGFTEGHPIIFKVRTTWLSELKVFVANSNFSVGNQTFGYGAFSSATLSVNTGMYSGINLSQSLLNFNSVVVGSTGSLPLTITNTGNSTLKISSITTGSSNFTLSKTALSIQSGASETINVIFTPTQIFDYNSSLTITSDAVGNTTKTILLHGLGTPTPTPKIQVTPLSLNFGGVPVNTTYILKFNIANLGNGNLSITSLNSSNPSVFAIENNPGSFILAQNQNRDIAIRFQPINSGSYNETVTINSPTGNVTVRLTGFASTGHFTPVPNTGLPYNVLIQNSDISGSPLGSGDEIAVFDGDLCVGSTMLTKGGKSLNLDGSNSYMQIPAGVWFSGDFTVETWVNIKSYDNYSRFFDFGNGQANNNVLGCIYGSTGKPWFEIYNGNSSGGGVMATSALPLNQWTHLAFVFRAGVGTIFMNGVAAGTGNMLAPVNINRTNNYIGKSNWSSDSYLKSLVDEVRIWNYGRSPAEIVDFMNKSLSGNEIGLKGYWNFENGTGKDLSPSAKNGTFIGNSVVVSEGAVPATTLVTAWQKDINQNLLGFTPGNPISFKLKSSAMGSTLVKDASPTYLVGNGTFGFNPYSLVNLHASSDLVPAIRVLKRYIYIGQIQINTNKKDTFYVKNTGSGRLNVSLSESSSAFSLNVLDGAVNPSDSLMVIVTFAPVTVGSHFADITINSNDETNPSIKVRSEGFALPVGIPGIETSMKMLKFSGVKLGTPKEMTFSVINIGTAPLVVNNITSNNPQFTVSPKSFTLSKTNDVAEITVIFTPTAKGLISATLSIASNAPIKSIELNGIGLDGHFESVDPTGLPYTIVIKSSNLLGYLKIGDEIAVYDGSTCVGSSTVEQIAGNIQVVAWKAESVLDKPGFIVGNQMSFKVWTKINDINSEFEAVPTYEIGDGKFGFGQFSVVRLDFVLPNISVLETDIFASAAVPNQITKKITISNTGNSTLFYQLTEQPAVAWLDADSYSGSLTPGQTGEITLTFKSSGLVDGRLTTTINITSNTPNKVAISLPVVFNITGEQMIESVPEGGIFRDTEVGKNDQLSFMVRNSGSAPISISNITFKNNNPAFSLQQVFTFPKLVEPMASFNLTVLFSPLSSTLITDSVLISSNASNENPLPISLKGKGLTPPHIRIRPLSFSTQKESGVQSVDSFYIKNIGQGLLNVTMSKNVPWLLLQTQTGSISASDSLKVKFNISTNGLGSGNYVGIITINSNDIGIPVSYLQVNLRVNGTRIIETSNFLNFDRVPINTIKRKWHQISNKGTDTLRVSAITTTTGIFTINSNTALKIAPNKKDSVELIFSPYSNSMFNDLLNIVSDAQNQAVLQVVLQGQGYTPPKIILSVDDLSEEVNSGSQLSTTLNISNSGLEPLIYSVELNNAAGMCLSLNGTTDYANILNSNSLSPTDALTIQAWIYPEDLTNEFIVGKEVSEVGVYRLLIDNLGNLRFTINRQYSVTSISKIAIRQWTHVCAVFSKNKLQVFINGQKDNEISIPLQTISASETDIRVGRSGSNEYFKGKIDELAIWNWARSESEIASSYFQNLFGIESGLALYIDFNVLQGNIAPDKTSNSNYGTLFGSSRFEPSTLPINNLISLRNNSSSVNAGENKDVMIDITSGQQFARQYSRVLKVVSNDIDRPVILIPLTIDVKGEGIFDSSINPLSFNDTFISKSDTMLVNFINSGSRSFTIYNWSSNENHFSILDTLTSMSPFSQFQSRVVFHPKAAGAISSNLQIVNNSGNNTYFVLNCLGTGVEPPIYKSTTSNLRLGDVPLGLKKDSIITISNDGVTPLVVSSVAFANSASLSISNTNSFTLNQGEKYEITVSFLPLALIPYAGELVLNTNIGVYKIPVTGKGTNAAFDVALSKILSVENGCHLSNSEVVSVRVRNYGLFPVTGFDVVLEVDGNQPVRENIGNITINPNDSIEYIFSAAADLSLVGHHVIKCYTAMSSDLNSVNNTKIKEIDNYNELRITISNPAEICKGDQIDIWASGGQTYIWSHGGTSARVTVKPDVTTTYTVQVTDRTGCSAVGAVTITVSPTPPSPYIIPLASGNICDGSTMLLNSDITLSEEELPQKEIILNSLLYQWFYNDQLIQGATSRSYIASLNGNYRIRTTNIHGCSVLSPAYFLEVTGKARITNPLVFHTCNGILMPQIALIANLNNTTFNWTATSHATITGYEPSGTGNIPATTYLLNRDVKDTVNYFIQTTTNGCAGNITKMEVVVHPAVQPGIINDLVPDNAENMSFPITLSWSPSEEAMSYDLYIWRDGENKPALPYVRDLKVISTTFSTTSYLLTYGSSYNWSVTANGYCYTRESDVKKFKIRYLPDLIASEGQVPSEGFSGQKFAFNYTIKNQGEGKTFSAVWTEMIYLSTDNAFDINIDRPLLTLSNFSALDIGEAYSQNVEVTLPNGIAGNYYIFIYCDRYSQLDEANNNNNISVGFPVHVSLTPPPDLQVNTVIAPNNAFSGEEITINWEVENHGSGSTELSGWVDEVYLSKDILTGDDYNYHIGSYYYRGPVLEEGDKYPNSTKYTIPREITGTYYIYVKTDNKNIVYEHASEANNTERSNPVQVTLSPPADLTVTNVTVTIQNSSSNMETINVQWTVENQGIAKANGRWVDKIYFSQSPTFDQRSSIYAGSLNHVDLETESSYQASLNIRIPDKITGNYYVYVMTDADNQIFEANIEANNSAKSVINIFTPDLIVNSINFPSNRAKSGDTISVGFDLKNIGIGKKVESSFILRVYISLNSTLNENEAIKIADITLTEALLPNQTISYIKSIIIPKDITGHYSVFFVADATNAIFETNEGNNILRLSEFFDIEMSQWANLKPTAFTTNLQIVGAGNSLLVNYSVINMGGTEAKGNWIDKFYISDKVYYDNTAIYLSENSVSQTLISNNSYTVNNKQITLPVNLSVGTYRLFVMVDATNTVYEYPNENDNLMASVPFTILAFPPSNLMVSSLDVQNTANSGETINVEFSVLNNSDYVTKSTQWKDAIYISNNIVLNLQNATMLLNNVHKGELKANESYTIKQNISIPNGISGNYFIHVVSDFEQKNYDSDFSNNYLSEPISIALSPALNLDMTEFTADFEKFAGQQIEFSWTVKNIGADQYNKRWTDRLYLSDDNVISSNDIVLFSTLRNPPINAGDSYTIVGNAVLPITLNGYKVLIASSNTFEDPYEANYRNNQKVLTLLVKQALISDLIVSDISMPNVVTIGENLNVSWTLKNQGQNPSAGVIQQAVYLSKDNRWDIDDLLLGISTSNINLSPGNELPYSINKSVNTTSMGAHYVFVLADIKDNFLELNEGNNKAISQSTINVQVPDLPLNYTETLDFQNNVDKYYKMEISSQFVGETMLFTIKGDTLNGNNQVYIRKGDMATNALYDYGSFNPFEGYQRIIIPELTEGIYYVLIKGNTTNGTTQNMVIKNKILEFKVLSASPNFGGRNGIVSTIIDGSKFSNTTLITLEKQGNVIQAANVVVNDIVQLFATFNLRGASTGVYDLVATNSLGTRTILQNGFTIQEQLPVDFQIHMKYPVSIMQGGIETITVEYNNGGNTNIYDPVVTIATETTPMAYTVKGLADNITTISIPLGKQIGNSRVLIPGERSSVVVYFKAVAGVGFFVSKTNSN